MGYTSAPITLTSAAQIENQPTQWRYVLCANEQCHSVLPDCGNSVHSDRPKSPCPLPLYAGIISCKLLLSQRVLSSGT